ncbi:hypothetical protein M378DRAFT_157445 [Amanita muscaria Koide BX008]|uniref:Uncharacterized protein n=1 Tax=Amanita muscaria (strain Koide BX008) TaxID=946122 RepID=A0A0C2XJG4_AMAMK|nr:hypothetical protein M378DRAFT_157445 [Amanita muscaria Koide BX008]
MLLPLSAWAFSPYESDHRLVLSSQAGHSKVEPTSFGAKLNPCRRVSRPPATHSSRVFSRHQHH